MIPYRTPSSILSAVFVVAFAASASAAPPAKDAAPQPQQRETPYEALEKQVGSRVVIHTVNNTTRTGTLVRYTNVGLALRVENGGYELSMPRKNVRAVFVVVPAADPLFPTDKTSLEAKPGAKKN